MNADRTRYETQSFRFLLIRVLRFSHMILRFFGFYPNYFTESLRIFEFGINDEDLNHSLSVKIQLLMGRVRG